MKSFNMFSLLMLSLFLGACEGEISFSGGDVVLSSDVKVKGSDMGDPDLLGTKKDLRTLDMKGEPDSVAPVISLKGDNPLFHPIGTAYFELGAVAVDAVDGKIKVEISGSVNIATLGTYNIIYSASDRAGNKSSETRVVNVVDAGPVITMKGRNPILLTLGDETYSEEGATAIDDVDGEVDVQISGAVDDTSIGVYKVVYTARDKAGHIAMKTRTVVVSQIRIGPYLQNATPTSIVVMWETPDGDETIVEYGESLSLGEKKIGNAITNNGGAQMHRVELDGLKPDHIYFYRVKTGESQSAIYQFRTVSEDREGNTNFVVYSDMQDGSEDYIHGRIIDESMLHFIPIWRGTKIIPDAIDFILIPGDLVDDGPVYAEWKDYFFDEAQPLIQTIPSYIVPGNHERNHINFYEFVDNPDNGSPTWPERWYFFDHGNVRVINLDTNLEYDEEAAKAEEKAWLTPVLAEACNDPKIDFVFAQFHHAHISELWPDGQSKTAKYFVDKLVEFSKDCDKASVHFYGHTHGFQRGQTRDHAHFYMNVASGEGDLDRWGVYDNQYNSEIIQKVVVQWGWSFVETEAGEDPKFTMRHIGVGSGENDLDFPGTEVDRITYRPKSVPPEKPTITRPKNETLSETTLVLEASAFVGKEKEAKHLSSHFQVTSTSGDYSDLVEEQWFRFEDLYQNNQNQSSNLNEGIDLTKSRSFELSNSGDYFWRVRYRDTGFKWSDWSEESKFTR